MPDRHRDLTLIDSTWKMTGNSNVTNLLNDPSVIDFAARVGDPTLLSSYKTLTVNNYVGEGGQIRLNTYLAGDGSPSDRLLIDGGTATGTTTVIARNTGGGGALTTGDGILVVDAMNGGTTAPGAFTGFAAGRPLRVSSLPRRRGSRRERRLVPAQHVCQPGPGPVRQDQALARTPGPRGRSSARRFRSMRRCR